LGKREKFTHGFLINKLMIKIISLPIGPITPHDQARMTF
jgi:hypothetical protein